MSEIHKTYDSVVNGFASKPTLCPEIPSGVIWKLLAYMDSTPYFKAECGRCKNSILSDSATPVFIHCGKRENAPQELLERFERRMAILKPKKTFIEKLFAPVPNI